MVKYFVEIIANYFAFQFVAHPNCQQVLQMDWENGFHESGKIFGSKILFLLGRMMALPFLCLLYLILPFTSASRSMKAPRNKYLNFHASYLTFIVFLAAQSEVTKRRHDHRGPPDSGTHALYTCCHLVNIQCHDQESPKILSFIIELLGLEWVLVAYIAGLTWRSIKLCWKLGRRKYLAIHWHK